MLSCTSNLTIVQTTPVGEFAVKPVANSLPTYLALERIANSSKSRLDFTAMVRAAPPARVPAALPPP
jgi:hypothetical protein